MLDNIDEENKNKMLDGYNNNNNKVPHYIGSSGRRDEHEPTSPLDQRTDTATHKPIQTEEK